MSQRPVLRQDQLDLSGLDYTCHDHVFKCPLPASKIPRGCGRQVWSALVLVADSCLGGG